MDRETTGLRARQTVLLLFCARCRACAPHHVAPEWSDKFKGQFDAGWDALRNTIFERQLAMGAIPPETVLTAAP